MLHAQYVEAARHGRDAVALFDAQFFRARDEGLPFRARGSDEQRRELVDRERHQPLGMRAPLSCDGRTSMSATGSMPSCGG